MKITLEFNLLVDKILNMQVVDRVGLTDPATTRPCLWLHVASSSNASVIV